MQQKTSSKSIAVSGVQPSGALHLGNYLGAIKQFVELQNTYHTYFFIVDLHAITQQQNPELLRKRTIEVAALYLAAGLDPQKTTLFIQSHVPEHAELGWILNTMTPLGELERMTQFKDKTKQQKKESVLAGLLNYPSLMAADILLYKPEVVPVGQDQLQHLELARTLARKFNNHFGETFKEPKALLQKNGTRIMSLDNPAKKMSKSASNKNYIALLDSESEIRKKIKSAVTDSGQEITFDPTKKPAISNLLTIFSLLDEHSIPELEKKYKTASYAAFKEDLANTVIETLTPIRDRYQQFAKNSDAVLDMLHKGAQKARVAAESTMHEVRQKIGFLE